jgi:nucleoside 2-deoxyribosyltransferase
MKIYVASSWRNNFQPGVVAALRDDGHEVYDFKDEEGFHWEEVDPNWKDWTSEDYIDGLGHHAAVRGYNRDMKALRECDMCVYVMPCGVSASIEMGWAAGAGKPVVVYIPELREPDLMVKVTGLITTDIKRVRGWAFDLGAD